jgi:predicted RND superfamily exporter protein
MYMEVLFRRPWLIVAVIALITIFFASWLPKIELDNNNLRFVPENDPALATSRWIDENFGSSFFILVGLQREYDTVFEKEFLDRIRAYIAEIEQIPIVKDVVSLVNADYIYSKDDVIVIEGLVTGNFSGTPDEIAELKRRLLSWDLYQRALISDDFSATQILIPLSITSEEVGLPETTEYFLQIRNLARLSFADLSEVYVTGMPIISASINESVNADLKLLVPLVIIVVLLILFFSYVSLIPMILPLLTVLIAVIWTVGAMPMFGIKLSVISTVLPVILVAAGSAYGIHIVTHYLADRGRVAMNREEHFALVLSVMRKMKKPVSLTAITTFAGFCSFCFTTVTPIREFGFFSSFGIMAAYTVAMTLVPSLLIIRGPKRIKSLEERGVHFDTILADNLVKITNKRKTVLFLVICIVLVSVYGYTLIVTDNAMVEYFKPHTDIYKSDRFIRENFGGSKVVSVVLQADSPEILLRPDTLTALDGLGAYLYAKVPGAGKVMGFTDLVKRINQVLNANADPAGLEKQISVASSFDDFGFGFGDFNDDAVWDDYKETEPGGTSTADDSTFTRAELIALFENAGSVSRSMGANDLIRELKRQVNYEGAAYYEIPADPARYGKESAEDLQRLVSNYLILLSGSIDSYANDSLEPTAIKSMVQLRTLGMYDSHEILGAIDRYLQAHVPPDVTITVGGTTLVEGSLNDHIMRSQFVTLIISIILVFALVAFANRSFVAGGIAIIPLSISVLINFAIMGFAGIKLNLGTSMVAAVSIAVGIDFAIHYIEAAKWEFRNGEDDFLRRGFLGSGKAIVVDAVSNGAGFAVLLFSSFNVMQDLGLLIAMTMLSSSVVSLTVLPVLITLIKPKFIMQSTV